MKQYPLARPGIFKTIQGEGALLGVPMIFVRLGGCSVGCPQCDTDYQVRQKLTATEIREQVLATRSSCQWVWLTGGEPADHDLHELMEAMRLCGKVALATSGEKHLGMAATLADFLSISPHGTPRDLRFTRGSQINLVPGLNGLRLQDWDDFDAQGFEYRYVTPLWREGTINTNECLAFVDRHTGWRLGVQAHKVWGVP